MEKYKDYPIAIDQRENIINELMSGPKKDYWEKFFNWFENYTPTDTGTKYIKKSFFGKNKHMQSFWMYKSMIKFMNYIYRSKTVEKFPWEYSSKRIKLIEHWFKTQYKLTEGTFSGKDFILSNFQVFLLSLMFGFTKKEAFKNKMEKGKGLIFACRQLYFTATRKNGKTEFFAGVVNFLIHNPFQNDAYPHIVAIGPDKDSSGIVRDKAIKQSYSTESINEFFHKRNTRNYTVHSGGRFLDLPFRVEKLEGQNPSLAIVTEYHLHPSNLMVNSFESAKNNSRINSILLFDTTKGEGIYGVAYQREMSAKKLIDVQLDHPEKIVNINNMAALWELDENDNYAWFLNKWDENIFRKSTPALGEIISLDTLKDEWNEIQISGDKIREREFLIKKGGKWIGNKDSLLTIQDMQSCNNEWSNKFDLNSLSNSKAECIIGVDLASSGDTNAISLIFKASKDGESVPVVYGKTFIPKETVKERVAVEKKPYFDWIDQDYVKTSGEKSVDYKDISKYIINLLKKYNVQKIYYDPYQYHFVKTYLVGDGISPSMFEEVKQGSSTLSSPLEDLIGKIYTKKFFYFDNPVILDQFLSFAPSYTSSGQMYLNKSKQTGSRIDMVASIATAFTKLDEIREVHAGKRKVGIYAW